MDEAPPLMSHNTNACKIVIYIYIKLRVKIYIKFGDISKNASI